MQRIHLRPKHTRAQLREVRWKQFKNDGLQIYEPWHDARRQFEHVRRHFTGMRIPPESAMVVTTRNVQFPNSLQWKLINVLA